MKSLNFSVSGESLPAEATKLKWRIKLSPVMSMTRNTPLASSSLTENTDTMPIGAAKAYAYIQLGKLYAVTFEPCPYDFKGARTLLAQDKRKAAQVVRGKLFRQRLVTGCLDYRYKFVFKKRLVLQACAWVTPSTMPKSISWFSRAFSMSRELPLASDTSIFGYLSVNSARI